MWQIRRLKKAELPLLFNSSKQENWTNEEVHTTALYKAHPEDFFIAFRGNSVVGFILAIRYSDKFGFISNFLILPAFRSQGYGKKLFAFACEHLKGSQIALDSVSGKEKFYENFGFSSYFDVANYVFTKGAVTLPSSELIVTSFDKDLALVSKDMYMKTMILANRTSYKAIKSKNSISSFGFHFKYKDGYKIYIDSQEINETVSIFFALIEDLENNTHIYMQTTPLEPLYEAVSELLKMKMYEVSVRMYNKVID